MRILLFAVIMTLLAESAATAETLYCEGHGFYYEKGFGKSEPTGYPISRLIEINKKKKTIKIEVEFDGSKTAQYTDDGKIIAAELPINKEIYKSVVNAESINLNQYTGEIRGIYILENQKMYSSFEGRCKKAKKAF
jgi:hypothetical protein